MDQDSTAEASAYQPARRRALRTGAVGVAAALCGGFPRRSGADQVPRRVLIIHYFGRDSAPFDHVVATFRRELASNSSVPVVFLEAALDAGREVGSEDEAPWVRYRQESAAASWVIVAQAALIAALLVQRARRRRAEREARALGGRLITAYEDEGRRLARELHDDITHRLNVGLKSRHLDPDLAAALVDAALLSLLVYPTAARVLLARAEGGTAPRSRLRSEQGRSCSNYEPCHPPRS